MLGDWDLGTIGTTTVTFFFLTNCLLLLYLEVQLKSSLLPTLRRRVDVVWMDLFPPLTPPPPPPSFSLLGVLGVMGVLLGHGSRVESFFFPLLHVPILYISVLCLTRLVRVMEVPNKMLYYIPLERCLDVGWKQVIFLLFHIAFWVLFFLHTFG